MLRKEGYIGVFDSGVGGLTVLSKLKELLPAENFVYVADSEYAPYGNLELSAIQNRAEAISQFLINNYQIKMVVVACNTATAAAVEYLREKYLIPFVGMEPAVKPASLLTKTGNIGVLATKGTLDGKLFRQKHEVYGAYVHIHYIEGAGLVELAEANQVDSLAADKLLKQLLNPMLDANVDQIVLGCTHYPLFISKIRKIVGEYVNVINPAEAIARRAKDLLMQNRFINDTQISGELKFYSNGNKALFMEMLKQTIPDVSQNPIFEFLA